MSKSKHAVVIVESPAKARTINRFLGTGFRVAASMGHVRDLPARQMGLDPDKGYAAVYQIIPGRRKVLQELAALTKQADVVYLAPDLDREGEAIAWHLKEALHLPDDKCRRVTFHEITRKAIQAAFAHPGSIDMNKVNAQQARRFLDRLVGYHLSPLLWKKVAKGLSAGRVQSVAVKLIVQREHEIRDFKPEEFWKITATLAPQGRAADPAQRFQADLVRWADDKLKIATEAEARALVDELRTADYLITHLEHKQRSEAPPPPFTTSTLQQQASTQLRFSAKRTMRVAQELYEGVELGDQGAVGLITYMRTDSVHVADEALHDCRAHIQTQYGSAYLPEEPRRYRSAKQAQEAHEAIRPTSMEHAPSAVQPYLSRDQARLYELIWKRFVASQMKPAVYAVTDVEITAGRGLFKAQGRRLEFDGWLRSGLAGPAREDQLLPVLAPGMRLDLVNLEPSQHFTQPPPRYTEATLVKTLEKEGIGRPSTYAPIISAIQERGYVEQRERRFFATPLGEVVTELLDKHFPHIMDVKFTSHMEEELDQIEEAKLPWQGVLDEFYGPFKESLERARQDMASVKGAETEYTCDLCHSPLVIRWSKRGRFLGCKAYPKCKFRRPLNGDGTLSEPVVTEHLCPECGKPMVRKDGRRGPFLACSGYPECKTIMNLDAEGRPTPAVTPTEHTCEKCGAPMVIRHGRRGPFLACSAFPKCRHARDVDADGNPVEPVRIDIKCDQCGSPMAVRHSRRGPFLGCTAYPKCKRILPLPAELKAQWKQATAQRQAPYAHIEVKELCPQCGSPMRIRMGRRGPFLGCSAYPKCKTAQPLPDDLAEQIGP